MAVTSKALFRGAASTSSTTLYTVPASTNTIVTNIVVTSANTAGTFTILLDDIELFATTAIAANSTAVVDLKQVLATTKTIKGFASLTSIDFHISGVEVV
ncbi:hypothetical protein uvFWCGRAMDCOMC455_038 [Freshwater phage uvFW-CGR-AMD-COM-C455]|nr:hypothetical protein uvFWCGRAMDCOMC455_038 [Freshwater phage uvFW-CGR-AMD-COM-C455]